jgi:hypothetical protein
MTNHEAPSRRRTALRRYLLLLMVLTVLVAVLWLALCVWEFHRTPAWLDLWTRSVVCRTVDAHQCVGSLPGYLAPYDRPVTPDRTA